MSSDWWRGDVLKKIRERRGLTQAALAEKVGVHQVTIARLETGERNPSMDLLQSLAKTLKVKVGELLEYDEGQIKELEFSDLHDKKVQQLLNEARQIQQEHRKWILASLELCLRALMEASGRNDRKRAKLFVDFWMRHLEIVLPNLVKRYKARKAQLGRNLTPDEFRELQKAN